MLKQIINYFYPPRCSICKQEISLDSDINNCVCNECNPVLNCFSSDTIYNFITSVDTNALHHAGRNIVANKTQSHTQICLRCGEPTVALQENDPICIACKVWPPPMRMLRSIWRYSKQSEGLIKALKYKGQHSLASFTANIFAQAIIGHHSSSPAFGMANWDLVLALPSGANRTRERGFSHMSLVLKSLSKILNQKHSLLALTSNKSRLPQVTLNSKQRHNNMKLAFKADSKLVQNKHILLIDDVITTGASLWSASWCLLDAGAITVDALTLARSKQFTSLRLLDSPVKKLSNSNKTIYG